MLRNRFVLSLMSLAIISSTTGCLGRLIGEGAGAVTGASGNFVDIQRPTDLSKYKAVRVETVTVSHGLRVPSGLDRLVKREMEKSMREAKFKTTGPNCLRVTGEVIHYESGGNVDKAIGPLEEVIVRTIITDDATNQTLGEANVIGRAKALTSSGAEHLATGSGKGLRKWLQRYHAEIKEEGDKDKQSKRHDDED